MPANTRNNPTRDTTGASHHDDQNGWNDDDLGSNAGDAALVNEPSTNDSIAEALAAQMPAIIASITANLRTELASLLASGSETRHGNANNGRGTGSAAGAASDDPISRTLRSSSSAPDPRAPGTGNPSFMPSGAGSRPFPRFQHPDHREDQDDDDQSLGRDGRFEDLRKSRVVDKYDSTSDMPAEMWIDVFEQATDGITGYERVRLLLTYVTKDALRWYAQFVTPSVGRVTWSQVRRDFIAKFSRLSAAPILSAKDRTLRPRETIQSYFDDKSRYLELARLPADAQIALLTDGVPDSYKTVISANGPRTVTEWLNVAQRYETTRRPEQKAYVAADDRKNTKDNRDSKPRFTPSSAGKDEPPSPCPRCLRQGRTEMHWARACPHATTPKSKNTSSGTTAKSAPAAESLNSNGGPGSA